MIFRDIPGANNTKRNETKKYDYKDIMIIVVIIYMTCLERRSCFYSNIVI